VDVEQSRSPEAATAEISRFIEKRAQLFKTENKERRAEAAWRESTKKAEEKRRIQARHEWHLHHQGQAKRLRRTLEQLIDHHEERAQELMESGLDAAS
jgi:ABC-type phosphonate transport system ATPase subunit